MVVFSNVTLPRVIINHPIAHLYVHLISIFCILCTVIQWCLTAIPCHIMCPLLQIELAILRFPYDSWGTPFQQLKQVVEEPSPQLPADQFSPELVDFTSLWYVLLSL